MYARVWATGESGVSRVKSARYFSALKSIATLSQPLVEPESEVEPAKKNRNNIIIKFVEYSVIQ